MKKGLSVKMFAADSSGQQRPLREIIRIESEVQKTEKLLQKETRIETFPVQYEHKVQLEHLKLVIGAIAVTISNHWLIPR